ncbi:MAG: phosphate ABC transporter substrate-binding protein [Proteocatella sp.]
MLFNKKMMAVAMTAVLAAGLLVGCSSKEDTSASDTGSGEKIVLVGSTSVDPLAQKLAEAYKIANPGVEIEIQAVGSSAGIKAVLDGSATIGMSSRELKEAEVAEGATPLVICKDGIAVALNPQNPVQDLTQGQIQKIFMGEITNWKEVGGNDEEILVVSRESGSGTRGAFEEILKIEKEVEGKKISGLVSNALQAEGTGAIKANVASKTNAIGYISLGYIDDTIKIVKVEGVDATPENIVSGTYAIARPFVLVTKGETSATDQAFLDFVMSSDGQAEAEKDGYIKIN